MKKGFTLFTALIGVMLIVISVFLVESMNNTERNAAETIVEARLDQEMLDVANLARADSMQQFNLAIRNQLQTYFSNPGNYSKISWGDLKNSETSDIADDFVEYHFISTTRDSFLKFYSREILNELSDTKDTPDYFIRITNLDEAEFKRVLKLTFTDTLGNPLPGFFEVVECDIKNGDCPKGTFYLNLNFKSPDEGGTLTDEDYEALPQIEVVKKSTCTLSDPEAGFATTDIVTCQKVIKMPIIPRTQLRVFVPLRIFKAVAETKQIAVEMENEGLLARLSQAKLGVCDSWKICLKCLVRPGPPPEHRFDLMDAFTCKPRSIPEELLEDFSPIDGKICIDHDSGTGQGNNEVTSVTLPEGEGLFSSYDPRDEVNTKQALNAFVFNEILKRENMDTLPTVGNLSNIDNDQKFYLEPQGDNFFANPAALAHFESFRSRDVTLSPHNDLFSSCTKLENFGFRMVFQELDSLYTISDDPSVEPSRFMVQVTDFIKDNTFPFSGNENEKIESCSGTTNPFQCSTGLTIPEGCSKVELDPCPV